MRKIHREIVGAFIFSKDNNVLLGKSRKGGVYKDCWIVPGGGIELDETKIDAVKREVLEEVGIDIDDCSIELLKKVLSGESEKVLAESSEHVLVEMTFYNFVIRIGKNASEIVVSCDDDIVEAKWFSITELAMLRMSPPTREPFQDLGYI